MLQEVRGNIGQIARETVGERTNADVVIKWIEHDPSFPHLLFDFDKVINRFNDTNLSNMRSSHVNTRDLKEQLGTTRLPTLTELLRSCDSERKRFTDTAQRMNTLLEEGEKPNPQEPYLSFHKTNTDTYALVVGSVFHFYEEYLLQDENYKKHCKPEQITCALIETLSRDRVNNSLYDAVANPQRLNWIDGYVMFSQDFIHEWENYEKLSTEFRNASKSAEEIEGFITETLEFDSQTARNLGERYAIAEAHVFITAYKMSVMDQDEQEINKLRREAVNLGSISMAARTGNYSSLKSYLVQCGKFQLKLASATNDPKQQQKLQILGSKFLEMANAL